MKPYIRLKSTKMASIINTVLVAIFCSVVLSEVQASNNNDLRCYFCEQQVTNACGDRADITTLTSAECRSLNYTPPNTSGDRRAVIQEVLTSVTDEKFRGNPILLDIFQRNTLARAEQPFKYVCVKVAFSADDKKGTIRSCVRQDDTVADACDLIKQEVGPQIKVNSCFSCVTDNCNSASFLMISNVAISLGLYLTISHQISFFKLSN